MTGRLPLAIVGVASASVVGAWFAMRSAPADVRTDAAKPVDAIPIDAPATGMLRIASSGSVAAFELDRTEVSVAELASSLRGDAKPLTYMIREGGKLVPDAGRDDLPAVGVTWTIANTYCSSRGKRLPTEAEWELAARGAEKRVYPWGNDEPVCGEVVFARTQGAKCWPIEPHEPGHVGTAPSDVTPVGVRDLGGNVSEWTSTQVGTQRVVRGGNWRSAMSRMRGTFRETRAPATAAPDLGFRCAL